MTYIVNF